jgi:uncharacterized membrane protein
MVWFSHVIAAWSSAYSNSAVLRTGIGFAHVGGLLAGGGSAIVADRATIAAWRLDAGARMAQARALHGTHRLVILGLLLVSVSGVLLLGADLDTYLHSTVFWIKMTFVVALILNGGVLVRAGRRAQQGDAGAWTALRYGALASLGLWFTITLLGAALPNV